MYLNLKATCIRIETSLIKTLRKREGSRVVRVWTCVSDQSLPFIHRSGSHPRVSNSCSHAARSYRSFLLLKWVDLSKIVSTGAYLKPAEGLLHSHEREFYQNTSHAIRCRLGTLINGSAPFGLISVFQALVCMRWGGGGLFLSEGKGNCGSHILFGCAWLGVTSDGACMIWSTCQNT